MSPAAQSLPALFTYGTLMEESIMAAVTGHRFNWQEGILTGYERLTVRGEVYPGIRPKADARTRGRIYFAINVEAVDLLDRFEGSLYLRQPVTVTDPNGKELAAEAYVVRPELHHRLSNQPWSLAQFSAEHLAAFRAACERFRLTGEGAAS